MQYTLDPPLCTESELQCMRMRATLILSSGDEALTATTVQWVLTVTAHANGSVLAFGFTENLLRCFVSGEFMSRWATENDAPMYEQTSTGFRAVFSRGSTFPPAGPNRRQVREMAVTLDFAYNDAATYVEQDTLFGDTVSLADYGFCTWMRSAETIAPAVFTSTYQRVAAIQPLFRPLKLALGLPRNSSVLEKITEEAVVGGASARRDVARGRTRPHAQTREVRAAGGAQPRASHRRRHVGEGSTTDPALAEIDPLLNRAPLDASGRPPADDYVWGSAGEFFRPARLESRRFVVLTGESNELHEGIFLSQLLH